MHRNLIDQMLSHPNEVWDMINSNNDNPRVSHPSHYTWLKELCGIEVIDIARHMDFNLGNSLKYILRAGKKKEFGISDIDKRIEDLEKAVWYINDEINKLKKDVL